MPHGEKKTSKLEILGKHSAISYELLIHYIRRSN